MFRGVMAKLQNKYAAGFQECRRLRDERPVNFRPGFAAEERDVRLMLADFERQRQSFQAADVGRVAGDEIE